MTPASLWTLTRNTRQPLLDQLAAGPRPASTLTRLSGLIVDGDEHVAVEDGLDPRHGRGSLVRVGDRLR